jgi:predicted RNA-binding protein YlxR (DUF448 family)
MCIGCRQRAAAAELLRVVAAPKTSDLVPAQAGPVSVVPDPRRRAPGRGAWLHLDLRCVDLAQRRQAFARALKVPAAIDPALVRDYIEEHPAVRRIGQQQR